NHAGNIRIRLCQRDAGLEPGDPQKTQVSQMKPVPLELQRYEEIGILPHQPEEELRHHADNLARPRIDRDGAANHSSIAAKPPLPVAVAQQENLVRPGRVILLRYPPPQQGSYIQRL